MHTFHYSSKRQSRAATAAFTIVELLIVIVVIAILATITIVAYNGIQNRATETAIASKESQAKNKLETYKVDNDTYPPDQGTFNSLIGQTSSDDLYTTYISPAPHNSYTLSTERTGGSGGGGTITTGSPIQAVTSANCPATRTMVVDARDNHTYWIQKITGTGGYEKCWMLTNLAYAGGGTNTYNDVIPTGDGTGGTLNGPGSGANTFTEAKYYVHTKANPTTSPTEPPTSTDGGATNPQYGYLYNWCAAMGAQTSTSACMKATTPAPNTSVSICPSGWILPNDELYELISAIGVTKDVEGSTLLRSVWYAQYGGRWDNRLSSQGIGYYWLAKQNRNDVAVMTSLYSSSVITWGYGLKSQGHSVRCLVP